MVARPPVVVCDGGKRRITTVWSFLFNGFWPAWGLGSSYLLASIETVASYTVLVPNLKVSCVLFVSLLPVMYLIVFVAW